MHCFLRTPCFASFVMTSSNNATAGPVTFSWLFVIAYGNGRFVTLQVVQIPVTCLYHQNSLRMGGARARERSGVLDASSSAGLGSARLESSLCARAQHVLLSSSKSTALASMASLTAL